jgi:hypothetical protein
MRYHFAKERRDYADYASGRVFYSSPGQPAFPVRLASEIFQRCLAVREASGATGPCLLYDPCCGGAYHLGTLAFMHWQAIDEIVGSDVDEQALSLAQRNLALLTVGGLDRRMAEIAAMLASYGKASHAAALESARTLRRRLLGLVEGHQVATRLFRADATDGEALGRQLGDRRVDVVLTDVPYGWHSTWQVPDARQASASPMWQMLEALRRVVSPDAALAIAADKRQKVSHQGYQRIERFRVGKRQVAILKLAGPGSDSGVGNMTK